MKRFICLTILLIILSGCGSIPQKGGGIPMYRKSKVIVSNGAKTNFQMQTIRLHKGTGMDTQSGSNDTVQHIYCGNNVDNNFASVRFYDSDGSTALKYRRINLQQGVSTDFIIKIPSIPSSGEKTIYISYAPSGYTTESTDETLPFISFDGWHRYNETGLFMPYIGLEQNVIYENGKFRNWFSKITKDPNWNGVDVYPWIDDSIYYMESTDGINWSAPELCVSDHGRSCVRKGTDGKYHMVAWPYDPTVVNNGGRTGEIDYYISDTGKPGTWTLVKQNIVSKESYMTDEIGNNSFIFENGQVKMILEYATTGGWAAGLWTGSDLQNLTPYSGNPVFSVGDNSGEIQLQRYNDKYVIIGHAGVYGNSVPTELTWRESANLEGPWENKAWALKLLPYNPNNSSQSTIYDSQLADPTVVEVNGKTYMFYEDIYEEKYDVPSLALATWDAPLERILDPNITTAKGDDLEEEGWVFDSGYGEVRPTNGDFPTTYFRKYTKYPNLMPVSVVAKTDSTHQLKVRKAINTPYDENVFYCIARAEQTNKKFVPFRLDKDDNNTILCGVYFDYDGNIKYYNGTTPKIAQAYNSSNYYKFKIKSHSTGYDLYIDGEEIATNIPYYSTFSRPQYFKVEQDSDAEGWINTLYTVQYSDTSTEPEWGITSIIDNTTNIKISTPTPSNPNEITQPVYSDTPSVLRVQEQDGIRNLVLVDTNDPNASNVRVCTSPGVIKALSK